MESQVYYLFQKLHPNHKHFNIFHTEAHILILQDPSIIVFPFTLRSPNATCCFPFDFSKEYSTLLCACYISVPSHYS